MNCRRGHVPCLSHRLPPSVVIMAEEKNEWVIEDSEEEDQLGSSQLDGHPPVLPGAHPPS